MNAIGGECGTSLHESGRLCLLQLMSALQVYHPGVHLPDTYLDRMRRVLLHEICSKEKMMHRVQAVRI